MKTKLLTLLSVLILSLALTSGRQKDLLTFAEKSYDFGTVTEASDPVVHEFSFTNVSDEPVAILSVSTQCGCTRPEYPTEPVAPGKSGVIKITFKPRGQVGEANKSITVRYRGAKARSSKRLTLRLRGTVTP